MVRGRGLLSHAAEGFRDQGFSGSLSWQQRPESDLGAMLSISQTMGGSSTGGADALLSRVNLEGLATNEDEGNGLQHQRTDLQLSYGFLAFGDRFTLTPELGLGLYSSGRDYRIGWSLARLAEGGSFDSFDLTRREEDNSGTAPEHGVELGIEHALLIRTILPMARCTAMAPGTRQPSCSGAQEPVGAVSWSRPAPWCGRDQWSPASC